ncbi:MAG: DUF1634 domain-containing protein [Bdellovibrio sp.]|nr:DUF1634 domain-containing protein [Bdellovibrio sp.]
MTLYDLELKISKLLRVGVISAGLVICVGWLWDVVVSGDKLMQFKDYRSISLADSVKECIATGHYATLVTYLGLTLLVLLPAARVLLTGILFLVQKERVLGFIAISVFVVLVASFSLGINFH